MPITSYDVIIRANIDLGFKSTHVIYFVFLLRVVIINLHSFTRQSANKSKLHVTNMTDDVPVIWDQMINFPRSGHI